MVHRDIEEALDLRGVQVHAQHPVGARGGNEVGDQFGGDRRTTGVLAILPGIAEVGNDGRDALGRGPSEAVDVDEQFHEVGIHRVARGLHDVAVAAADVLVNPDDQLAIGEEFGLGDALREIEVFTHLAGQFTPGSAAEDLQMIAVYGHVAASVCRRC